MASINSMETVPIESIDSMVSVTAGSGVSSKNQGRDESCRNGNRAVLLAHWAFLPPTLDKRCGRKLIQRMKCAARKGGVSTHSCYTAPSASR